MTTTGIAGLTLGAGSGWLERLYGYTAAQPASRPTSSRPTAALIRASEDENADLFWGLRGGGGNFGVVMHFEYRLHEVGADGPRRDDPLAVRAGGRGHSPLPATASRPRRTRSAVPSAILTAPPAPFVPTELQGQPVVARDRPISFAEPELLRPDPRVRTRPLADLVGRDAVPRGAAAVRSRQPAGASSTTGRPRLVAGAQRRADRSEPSRTGSARSTRLALVTSLPAARRSQLARVPDDASAINPRRHATLGRATALAELGDAQAETGGRARVGPALGPSSWSPSCMAGVPLTFSADTGDERVRATLRGGEVRASRRAEGQVRPREPLPPEPEHQAELGS